jgi:hypothetical protein
MKKLKADIAAFNSIRRFIASFKPMKTVQCRTGQRKNAVSGKIRNAAFYIKFTKILYGLQSASSPNALKKPVLKSTRLLNVRLQSASATQPLRVYRGTPLHGTFLCTPALLRSLLCRDKTSFVFIGTAVGVVT